MLLRARARHTMDRVLAPGESAAPGDAQPDPPPGASGPARRGRGASGRPRWNPSQGRSIGEREDGESEGVENAREKEVTHSFSFLKCLETLQKLETFGNGVK